MQKSGSKSPANAAKGAVKDKVKQSLEGKTESKTGKSKISMDVIPNGKDKGKVELAKTGSNGKKLYFGGIKDGKATWFTDYAKAKRVSKATAKKYMDKF